MTTPTACSGPENGTPGRPHTVDAVVRSTPPAATGPGRQAMFGMTSLRWVDQLVTIGLSTVGASGSST